MNINNKRKKRALRVRGKAKQVYGKKRISVFRSLNQIYAQVIDDQGQKTLMADSSLHIKADEKNQKLDKTAIAKLVGFNLGKKIVDANLDDLYFDRGCYLYHGRVKALADGLREAGVKI
jgi:large subunit ribosomal protein L18